MRGKVTRTLLCVLLLCAAVAGLTALRQYLQSREDAAQAAETGSYARPAAADDPLVLDFQSRYPQRTVLLACTADISDDGRTDLVAISQQGDDISAIALVAEEDGTYTATPPIPAPREEQKIRFFNMDKGPQLEVLITGAKNGQVGYAIYRLTDGTLKDLFGEGMENCC